MCSLLQEALEKAAVDHGAGLREDMSTVLLGEYADRSMRFGLDPTVGQRDGLDLIMACVKALEADVEALEADVEAGHCRLQQLPKHEVPKSCLDVDCVLLYLKAAYGIDRSLVVVSPAAASALPGCCHVGGVAAAGGGGGLTAQLYLSERGQAAVEAALRSGAQCGLGSEQVAVVYFADGHAHAVVLGGGVLRLSVPCVGADVDVVAALTRAAVELPAPCVATAAGPAGRCGGPGWLSSSGRKSEMIRRGRGVRGRGG